MKKAHKTALDSALYAIYRARFQPAISGGRNHEFEITYRPALLEYEQMTNEQGADATQSHIQFEIGSDGWRILALDTSNTPEGKLTKITLTLRAVDEK